MSYYMRYLITEDKSVSLDSIEVGLRTQDQTYRILREADGSTGDLLHGGVVYAQIEINRPGDEIFDEDIAELRALLPPPPEAGRVHDALDHTTAMVAVEIGWQGLDPEDLLDNIDPLWEWLEREYRGLLQVDSEGFYEGDEHLLAL